MEITYIKAKVPNSFSRRFYIVTVSYSFTQFSTLAKTHTATAREPSIYTIIWGPEFRFEVAWLPFENLTKYLGLVQFLSSFHTTWKQKHWANGVYFDQQMGDSHTLQVAIIFFDVLTSLYVMNRSKEVKKRYKYNTYVKHW